MNNIKKNYFEILLPTRRVQRTLAKVLLAMFIINGGMVSSVFASCGLFPYQIDYEFDSDGFAITDFGNSPEIGWDIAAQTDGKIIMAGRTFVTSYDFGLVRYNTNGSVDTTFGASGKATVDFSGRIDEARGVAVQADGKIVVVGQTCIQNDNNSANFAMARFNSNGNRDLSFGSLGKVSTDFDGSVDDALKVAIQPDGKIVVVGRSRTANGIFSFAVARYNTTGSLDTTFNSDGKALYAMSSQTTSNGATDLAIQPDGKIVIVGESDLNFGVIRIQSNGSLDRSFGSSSRVSVDFFGKNDMVRSVALQSDGKIVLGGSTQQISPGYGDVALARLNTNGTLDNSFGTGGRFTTSLIVTNDEIYDIAIKPNGDIVSVGALDGAFFVGSYNPNVATSYNPYCPQPDFLLYSTYTNDNRSVRSVLLQGAKIYGGGSSFVGQGDFMVVALEDIIDL